jgi:hypothetical protein
MQCLEVTFSWTELNLYGTFAVSENAPAVDQLENISAFRPIFLGLDQNSYPSAKSSQLLL